MLQKIDLPYSLNALEPFYDRETLNIHYNTLYSNYIENTNKTKEKLKQARKKNDFENIKCLEKELSFQGSGAILHELFFKNMAPATLGGGPNLKLMQQINKDFGTFPTFKSQFTASSKVVEASRLEFTCMGSKMEQIRNFAMRKTSKFNTLGLYTITRTGYVGTFLLSTIQSQSRRIY